MVKRLNTEEVREVFQERVGQVLECTVVEDTATLVFRSEADAQEAVKKYDGGLLEASIGSQFEENSSGSLALYPNTSNILEDRVGPLSTCYLRRGEGWMTIFQTAAIKQLRNGINQIDYKASFIKVCIDIPSWLQKQPDGRRSYSRSDGRYGSYEL